MLVDTMRTSATYVVVVWKVGVGGGGKEALDFCCAPFYALKFLNIKLAILSDILALLHNVRRSPSKGLPYSQQGLELVKRNSTPLSLHGVWTLGGGAT